MAAEAIFLQCHCLCVKRYVYMHIRLCMIHESQSLIHSGLGAWFRWVTWLLVSIPSPKQNKGDLFERQKPHYSGRSFGQAVDLNPSNFSLLILL